MNALVVTLAAYVILSAVGTAQESPGQRANLQTSTLSQNQAVITNRDVVAMLKAGISSEIIAAKIRNSKCQCDTSPAALAQLKAAGVPDNVILALVQSTSPTAQKQPRVTDIRDAKTVYLVNKTTDFKVFENFPKKLKEWQRWTVVERPEDADLLLVFSGNQTYVGSMNTASVSGTSTYASGVGTSIPLMSDQRFLIAVEASTERLLAAVSCERRLGSGYTAGVLVNRMRKHIEKLEETPPE